MHELCESCGTMIVNVTDVVWCMVCQITPYCSIACRQLDADTIHHRKTRIGTCMDPGDKNMWTFLAYELNMTHLSKLPLVTDVDTNESFPVCLFPGPLTGRVPHCMRHSDDDASSKLRLLSKSSKRTAPDVDMFDNQQPSSILQSTAAPPTVMIPASKCLIGDFYYIIRFRDMPRLWFRQLTVEQRREIRSLINRGLSSMVSANQHTLASSGPTNVV